MESRFVQSYLNVSQFVDMPKAAELGEEGERGGKPDKSVEGVEKGHAEKIDPDPPIVQGNLPLKEKEQEPLQGGRKERDKGGEEAEVEGLVSQEVLADAEEAGGYERVVQGVEADGVVGEKIDEAARKSREPENATRLSAKEEVGNPGSKGQNGEARHPNPLKDERRGSEEKGED